MISNPLSDAARDERLNEVLLAYIEQLQAGEKPDRRRLFSDYPELRPDLEAFFASHDQIERMAAPLRAVAAAPASGAELASTSADVAGAGTPFAGAAAADIGQLGDFRLLREVGRGGMGVVYEAEQVSLRRRVALKMLPFAAAIDQRQLQRFKNEALAAAHLRHPNIVPVYAVGCERGVHYYAMQFIEGRSLSALLSELRGPGEAAPDASSTCSAPPDAATIDARTGMLDTQVDGNGDLSAATLTSTRASGGRKYYDCVAILGKQAALALEHAHQMGIVHRDIKPSNMLLDPHGNLWVADFGLAQIESDPGLTMTGELLGTLRYASPEQVSARRGFVDHRSDVYSLGATLYELLTLRPVLEGRDRHELLRQIAEDDPRPPRGRDRGIPEELETIVLKAIRKEPSERYASASELADDLQRYLENRPILARRPGPAERLRKWARRHPSVVGAGAVLLVFLSVGSLASTAIIRRAQQGAQTAQEAAESAYLRERQRAEEAESRFQLARRSADELIQVSEEELARWPGTEAIRKRLLSSALAYYQEFIDLRRDDSDAQAELQDTKRKVERILADLAVLRAASQLYLLCQPAVLDELQPTDDQRTKIRRLCAQVGKQWKTSLRQFGRIPPAERGRRKLERARANEAALDAILTAQQHVRLRQIRLQSEGPAAFREPEVAAALELTAEQQKRVREIEDEATLERMKAAWPGMSPERETSGDAQPKRTAVEQILEILTAEQRRRWTEMTGEPFQDFSAPFAPAANRRSAPKGEVN